MKNKLIISFSGGRTSAYMTWWLLNKWEDRNNWEMLIVFANTGKEVEGTLFFIDECAAEWNIPITWVEGYPRDKGKGWAVRHKIVSYETAARNGEPFEAMIARLGIPSSEAPFCSPQLKREAIFDFARSIGWVDYKIAIGIRIDEPKRVKKNKKNKKIILPLVHLSPINKVEIILWWKQQPFDLDIHPDDGNCDNCWKKGYPMLVRNMVRRPDSFNWWQQKELEYGRFNPRDNEQLDRQVNFFRGNKGVVDIRELAELSQAQVKQLTFIEELDGCAESCEVF